ncbi:MAG TPA: hypothetical protein DEQ80_04250 [Anaerolinea thermolimosa]|uniref:HTH lacI-type domain-containing protein n=1 Tax=Anaerolinea thermolimosa TaxID=229919 RepID=A0A3D1JEN5_9CHLR|nr:hypothetical protein [Anaerolinea thermolimosa]
MPVTIRDLARHLNLSITTVSRALDGYTDVSEETRQRVIAAARELGYEPSYAARQLRRRQAGALGYILPSGPSQFSDPYSVHFITGLCDEASTRQVDLVISSAAPGSEQEKRQYHHWVQTRRVDGFVLNRLRMEDWRVAYLTQNRIPFAVVSPVASGEIPAPRVEVQDRRAMEELVAHLIEQGHRRIAYIGGPAYLLLDRERQAGYREVLARARIAWNPQLVVEGDLTEAGGYRAALNLLRLSQPPTALVCCNDLTALGALRAARELQFSIGSELAISGFDGLKETEYTHPPLTTVARPAYEIGRQVCALLHTAVNRLPVEEQVIVIQPELIIRASTRG